MPSKVRSEITYPFPNGCTIGNWRFIMLGLKLIYVSKRGCRTGKTFGAWSGTLYCKYDKKHKAGTRTTVSLSRICFRFMTLWLIHRKCVWYQFLKLIKKLHVFKLHLPWPSKLTLVIVYQFTRRTSETTVHNPPPFEYSYLPARQFQTPTT